MFNQVFIKIFKNPLLLIHKNLGFFFEGEYTTVGKVLYGLKALEKIKHNYKSEYVLRPDFINHFKMLKDL